MQPHNLPVEQQKMQNILHQQIINVKLLVQAKICGAVLSLRIVWMEMKFKIKTQFQEQSCFFLEIDL